MNRTNHDNVLLRIATALVDDDAVDWDHESYDDVDVRRKVNNLRLLQSIGHAQREVREEFLGLTITRDDPERPTWGKLQILCRLGSGEQGGRIAQLVRARP